MKQPLRVLYVSHSFPPEEGILKNVGGMQRVAMELHAALKRQEEVHVVDRILRTTDRWIEILAAPFLIGSLWKIPYLARKHSVDVVLYTSMVTAALAPFLKRRLQAMGIRQVAIVHGRDVTLPASLYQWYVPKFLPWIFQALDAVLPVSRATAKESILRGLPPERCFVVPNGIAVERFPEPPPYTERRMRLQQAFPEYARQLTPDTFILCSVGRHVERKGFHWFIQEVMPHLPEHVQYWLVGEGPLTPRIQDTIQQLGLQQRVHLLGKIPDEALTRLYQGADLFIMPNIPVPGDMEGFGVVMLEASLNELPVIASALEGIQDVVAEGENGHLVAPRVPEGFIQWISYYAQHPNDLRKLSQKARAYVRRQFAWEVVAQQYVERLRQIAGQDTSVPASVETG